MSNQPAHRPAASTSVLRDSPPDARQRWRDFLQHWGLVVAISIGALAVLAGLGENVFNHAPGTVDDGARAWALAHRTPTLLQIFIWISRLGAPIYVFALAAVVALWLWRAQARHVAAVVVGAPIVAVGVFNLVKLGVHRTRPAGGLLLPVVTYSFPSGHATASAAVFATLGWVLAREGKLAWGAAVPLAIVPPLLIGFSRVYLDVHWATDVVAGWCAGAAVAALSAGVYERGRRRRAHAV